jgi:drug/metabolite transporter (DMT)-like permease
MATAAQTSLSRAGRRRGAAGLLAGAALSWGLAIVLTKITLEQLAPLDVLFVELVVGAAFLWLVLLRRGGPGALRRWRAFACLGLLEPGLSFVAGDFGLNLTGAADGAFLLASESLFAIALAWVVLGERLGGLAAAAAAVGFAGSVLIGVAAGGGDASLLGDGLVLIGSASAGAYSVAARRIAAGDDADALTVTAVQLLAAAVASFPLFVAGAAAGQSQLGRADAGHLLAAVATGVASSALPFLLYNAAIRDVEVTAAALIQNLTPVFGVGLAVVLIGEHLRELQLAGGALVLVAALAAERVTRSSPAQGC